MVSTKFFLIATLYFTSMKIAHCGDTIACTASTDCTSTQKCIDVDGVNKACVETCTTDADCGGTAGSCAATTTGDVGGATGFSLCPLIIQQCLTDAECTALDATLPICNLYSLTCVADTTAGTTTTAAGTTTTTVATTTTTTKAPTTTTKSSSTTCADQVTGGSNDCASLAAYCTNSLYLNLMKEKCPKTCGYCTTSSGSSGSSGSGSTSSGCTDQVTGGSNDCTSMISYCTNTLYKDLMKQKCAKTCGYCTSSSSSSGSTSTGTCKDASSDCSSKSYLCKNSLYLSLMKTNCPLTCGYC
uniref:ShKT domain-containing protein n=1 Tax=Strongyloides papillosus TaxID=174720 RepID=A0A0N5BFP4_STREA